MDSSKTQSLVSDLIRFLQKWGLWEDTTFWQTVTGIHIRLIEHAVMGVLITWSLKKM